MVLRLKTRESRSLPGLLNARLCVTSYFPKIEADFWVDVMKSSLHMARQRETSGRPKRPFHLVDILTICRPRLTSNG